MKLTIVSPENVLYCGEVDRITVPGTLGRFEVLANHAPIISSLEAGTLLYKDSEERSMDIKSGFIEVDHNTVTVCVEV